LALSLSFVAVVAGTVDNIQIDKLSLSICVFFRKGPDC
jgi:hypothetical protein